MIRGTLFNLQKVLSGQPYDRPDLLERIEELMKFKNFEDEYFQDIRDVLNNIDWFLEEEVSSDEDSEEDVETTSSMSPLRVGITSIATIASGVVGMGVTAVAFGLWDRLRTKPTRVTKPVPQLSLLMVECFLETLQSKVVMKNRIDTKSDLTPITVGVDAMVIKADTAGSA